MSSKRGRKRNDNLPPNRARDVQRAFRARRAAHLQALEARVAELEEENDAFRSALGMNPANRPALGKGPTGKDKPKTAYPPRTINANHATPSNSPSSSSRTQSLSPTDSMTNPASQLRRSPDSLPALDSTTWEHPSMMLQKDGPSGTSHHASPATPFSMTPISGPPSAHLPSFFGDQINQRHPHSATMYLPATGTQNITHSSDRQPSMRDYADDYMVRDHQRDERHHYSYSQPSFPSHQQHPHDQGSLQSAHVQSSGMHSLTLEHRDSLGSTQPQSFAHRRSITEPQSFRGIINQVPSLENTQPSAYNIKLPAPHRVEDTLSARSGFDLRRVP